MTQNADFVERHTPGFAKAIMLLQMLLILFLSSWIVEEYLNNIYLQAYVNDVVSADGALIAILLIVCALGAAVGLLKVLKSTHKEIGALVNHPETPSLAPATIPSTNPSPPSTHGATDLHPMVAALKAEMAHHASMEPLRPAEVNQASAPPSPPAQVQPVPPPVRSQTAPSTVITGSMPVLKRVNPGEDRGQNSQQ